MFNIGQIRVDRDGIINALILLKKIIIDSVFFLSKNNIDSGHDDFRMVNILNVLKLYTI